MLSEKEVRELLGSYEEKIEDLKVFVNDALDTWTSTSENSISAYTKTIGLYKHKIHTLRAVLEELK